MRVVGGLSWVVGLGAVALTLVLTSPGDAAPAEPGGPAVPRELAAYSHLTSSVASSPPGAAVALFQHGWGVELLDFPQAVVLGAGGDAYRRVDAAEDRASAASQGDPAPMLLSPDGTKVAVGDHETADPDVVVVDLLTGEATSHPLPTGQSVLPVAWSRDGTTLAHLLSPEPTDPYTGERVAGEVGVLALGDDSTDLLPGDDVTAVAFSPDGTELAVERAGTPLTASARISVVHLASGATRDLGTVGVLAGPAAWSPDGRLVATTTLEPSGAPAGLAFVDPSPSGSSSTEDLPDPMELPLAEAGRVLGWTDAGEVVALLGVAGDDACCAEAYELSRVPLDGAAPQPLMRISDLQGYGVGRFQMASATVGDLRVVTPGEVDRGPWPPWLRGGLALLAGLFAWLSSRGVLRRTSSAARVTAPQR
ncbi:hypothetical protein GCM10009641_75170 [Mycobacterium cookii]|uniref:WD40 repeat domain-containing protein n=1 Tax=Nocardioides furvisabuli TaxID=375542 RepID=A0ABP5ITD8_9ACTN|nr:hypothetical protein [Nocardioides furvisabuli]